MNNDSKTRQELIKEVQDLQEKYNAILDLYKKEIIVDKLNSESSNTASKLSKEQTLELIQKLELEHDELILLKEETKKFQFLSNEILVLLNSSLSLKKIIDAVLKLIQTKINFSAIGICLKIDNDLPYFSQIGFSESCILKENSLVTEDDDELLCKNKDGSLKLECTCASAFSGKTNLDDSSLTIAGSFITNNAHTTLELFTDKNTEVLPKNSCIHSKYGSVAVIPILANEKIVGTLQLNHKEVGVFSKEEILFFEGICSNIGTALMRKQAEEIVKESEKKYRSLIKNMPDGVYKSTDEGKFIEVNPAMVKILGYDSKEELRSIDIKKQLYFELSDRESVALQEEEKELGVYRMKKKDGTEVWVEDHGWLNFDKTKNILFHEGVLRDITERMQAEEKLRKLSQAVEQSPITIVITDTKGNIEYVNPKFVETTGYSLEDVIGQNPRVLKSGQTTQEEYKQLWETVNNGGDWRGEFLNKRKNGELYWESASISPITDVKGKTTHFIAIKEEITYRKETELLLEEKNHKIKAQNEEYKHLNEELIIAKNHAEESDKLKTSFLANMSHEIRTPMNGILGFAGLLKDPMLSGDEQKEYIDIIEKSGTRMLNIINDIIDISKIESGLMKVKMTESNINDQIEYIYTFFKPEVESKGMKLSHIKSLASIDSIIRTDREKVFAILINLVKNAIKYSNEGLIEFGYIKKGEYLEFFVSDTGIGIPKNRQKAVFERFIQADIDDKMAVQGAGLGLSISKAFVEMLGGKIWLDSELGKGSTFYFTIPYDNKVEEKKGDQNVVIDNEIVNHLKKLKILIAEDDEISKLFINKVVQPFSKETLNVSNGAEVVAACSNNPDIDLILMDIKMPIMDGYEATQEIRQFNKDVVIIAQSAYGLSRDIRKAINVGCNDHISKPIDKHEFLTLLQKHFT